MMIVECGLFWVSIEETRQSSWRWQYIPERRVPLQHVAVEACLVETTSEVKIVQKYYNPNHFPIEAIYIFPLDERAAINEFEAEIDGKKLIGIVKGKEQAKAEYNAAVSRGDGAYLLEQEKADIFRARVGNIPPHTEVSITIKYVAEMKNELEKIRFVLPTKVAPRYTPSNGWWSSGSSSAPAGSTTPSSTGMSLSISCVCLEGFESIESPSHSITTSISGHIASVGLLEGITALDKDFVLLVGYAKPHEPKVVIEEDGKGSYAAMVTLFPHLEFADAKTELIFVVDRSGSMQSKISELKEAMSLFMRSLPVDCFFNILGFGSSFTQLLPHSQRYDDSTLKKASQWISKMAADLGGTELYRPLEHVFRLPLIPGYARQVFVLTDGQISNTQQVFDLIQRNNIHSRVFSLGIGNSVSHHLVEGIARAGKGTSAFALENERIERKVMKQLKDAIQPALNQVKVDWGLPQLQPAAPTPQPSAPTGSRVLSLLNYVSPAASAPPSPAPSRGAFFEQAPFQVPSIYSDSHFRIYCIFSSPKLPEAVTIEAQSPDGLLKVELPVNPERIIKGNLIHTLAARSLIRDLEEGSSQFHSRRGSPSPALVRDEIIRLAIKYNLASKHTSFLAVERRGYEERVSFNWSEYEDEVKAVPVQMNLNFGAPGSVRMRSAPAAPMMYKSAPAPAPSYGGAPGFALSSSSSSSSSLSTSSAAFGAPPSARRSVQTSAPLAMKPSAPPSFMKAKKSMSSSAEAEERKESFSGHFDLLSFDDAPSAAAAPSAAPSFSSYPAPAQPTADSFGDLFAASPAPSSQMPSLAAGFPFSTSQMDPFAAPPPPPAAAAAPSAPFSSKSSGSQNANYTKMANILSFQSAQGSFGFEKELVALLNLDFSRISQQLSSLSCLTSIGDLQQRQSVFATALVVAFFRRYLKELEEDWEMVEMKAKRWMASLKLVQLQEINDAAVAAV